jgi:hypothetical protein
MTWTCGMLLQRTNKYTPVLFDFNIEDEIKKCRAIFPY